MFKRLSILIFISALLQPEAISRDKINDEKDLSSFAYDEIPVLVIVEGYPNFYVEAIYANNDLLYINVSALFQSLDIPCITGQQGDSLAGFIEKESRTYLIDYKSGQIVVGEKKYNTEGLVKEMGALFLESSLFAEIFGLSMTFNYRTLTLILKSDFELPMIRELRLEKMRNNVLKLQGKETADTIVGRNYHLFKFGMLDWSLGSYQTWNLNTYNRFGLGIGAELFHGEADIAVQYYDRKKFDNRQLYYLWRWVDNDKRIIKQAQLGKISNQTISFINAPVIGATIRNTPTTIRKATGYYTINEYTEPNWTVELYINNVMVDYTKADASGLFVFKVPNTYGYTTLKLKFYGPLGEERTVERTMNVPHTIMPAGELEYSLSAGIIQDGNHSRFGKGELNYGVNRILTLGAGLEYLSSISDGSLIPFARATIQPFSKMTFIGEYAYGVKTRGLLNYYFWKDALLEIDYIKYVDGQLATRFNALQERKVKLSLPFRMKKIRAYSKLEYSQFVYKGFNYNVTNARVSSFYRQFSASSAVQFNWINNKTPFATTDLSLSYRLKKGFTIRPSAQYNIGEHKFMSYKAEFEKSISRGYLTIAYERNLLVDDHFFSLNFRYDLKCAKISSSIARSNAHTYTSENIQGSLGFGSGKKHIHTSNNSSVSKGGIALYPFLDLNNNGVFDKDEPMVLVTSVRVMGGKALISEKDSIIRISDQNAFTYCMVEFSDNDLDNIAWRFKHNRFQVLIDPNQFKRIDIPVISVGEANGMIYINKDNVLKGLGRILVKFYENNSNKLVAETLSESDGHISFLGLEPGEYIAKVDSAQLKNLDFTVKPEKIDFTVKSTEEGEIFSNLDFVLNYKATPGKPTNDSLIYRSSDENEFIAEKSGRFNEDSNYVDLSDQNIKINISSIRNKAASDSSKKITIVWGDVCTQPGMYCVQCGAFRQKSYAMRMALKIKQTTDFSVGIVFHNGLYKVRVGCVITRKESAAIKKLLVEKGVGDDLFIVIKE